MIQRDEIDNALTKIIDEKTDRFGINVIDIELQEIDLPRNIENSLAIAAQSSKEADAKLIAAQGAYDSAKIYQ